jgi:hypothetical protein
MCIKKYRAERAFVCKNVLLLSAEQIGRSQRVGSFHGANLAHLSLCAREGEREEKLEVEESADLLNYRQGNLIGNYRRERDRKSDNLIKSREQLGAGGWGTISTGTYGSKMNGWTRRHRKMGSCNNINHTVGIRISPGTAAENTISRQNGNKIAISREFPSCEYMK